MDKDVAKWLLRRAEDDLVKAKDDLEQSKIWTGSSGSERTKKNFKHMNKVVSALQKYSGIKFEKLLK